MRKKTRTKPRFSKFFNSIRNFFWRKKTSHSAKDTSMDKSEMILANADHFEEKIVEDVMVPRSDIVSADENISLENLQKLILDTGHTRILIFKENLDNIIGFVHIKDIFELLAKGKKFTMKNIVRNHLTCPHSMKLSELLKKMQYNRTHMSVVIDEYGGTDGLITIEDIIEELVGRIDDEHDTDENTKQFKIIEPGVIVTNARVEIAEIEEILDLSLQDEGDEIDTIGGLVMSITGTVPEKGTKVELPNNVEAEIIESTPRVIKELRLKKLPE